MSEKWVAIVGEETEDGGSGIGEETILGEFASEADARAACLAAETPRSRGFGVLYGAVRQVCENGATETRVWESR